MKKIGMRREAFRFKAKLAVLLVTGVLAVLWAAPAAADSHLQISIEPESVPAEAGDVTITVSGTSPSGPLSPFFVTKCPGAGGDPTRLDAIAQAGGDVSTLLAAATQLCPSIMADAASPDWDDGAFSHEITISITDDDIANGAVVVLAAGLSGADPKFAFVALKVGEQPTLIAEPTLADTGANSNLLLIVGVSVLATGLLVLAQGRRVRSVH